MLIANALIEATVCVGPLRTSPAVLAGTHAMPMKSLAVSDAQVGAAGALETITVAVAVLISQNLPQLLFWQALKKTNIGKTKRKIKVGDSGKECDCV